MMEDLLTGQRRTAEGHVERISKRSASSDAVVNKANVEKDTELNSIV